jgi:AraC family transcriptional regulator
LTAQRTEINYVESVNLAIDYIVRNLDREVKLEPVAEAAGFSPFHFHRVFRSLLGETLNEFVKRLRLERAVYWMSHTPDRSLTEISLQCGFSSSSDFSRSFKSKYGIAPSAFQVQQFRDSKRQEFEAAMASLENGPRFTRLPAGENPDGFQVTIRDLPARTVAYIRALDPYRSTAVPDSCQALLQWAEHHNLADGQWLGYMWEDPEIVAVEHCRYDVAVVVDPSRFKLQPEGVVGRWEFPPMRVAEVTIRGDIHLEMRALDWLFRTWLPGSKYVPDDQPCFEAWHGRPFAHGHEYFELSCHLPVRSAVP